MKKISIIASFALAVCLSAFALTGCGEKAESTSQAAAETTVAETTEAEKSSNSSGKFASIEDYLNDPTVKSALDTTINSSSTDDLTLEVKAEDNKLIYEYTYTEVYEADSVELMKESLATASDSFSSTFNGVVNSLEAAVDVENPVVVTRYNNGDGTLIYEQEFTGEEE